MSALLGRLESIKNERSIDVEILGAEPNARIPGLKGPRAKCTKEGIIDSDTILVPLEDGDRCEALVAMGKTVIVIDLNPLSRSAKMGTITIFQRDQDCIRINDSFFGTFCPWTLKPWNASVWFGSKNLNVDRTLLFD